MAGCASNKSSRTTKTAVAQALEGRRAFALFFGVDGASRAKTVSSNTVTTFNNKYNLGSGTYCLKTELTPYSHK